MNAAVKQMQGNKPSPTNNSPAGNIGNVVGNQPSPMGPGMRPPMPQGAQDENASDLLKGSGR